jgi:hypothetical protein
MICSTSTPVKVDPRRQAVRKVLAFIILDFLPVDHERKRDITGRSPCRPRVHGDDPHGEAIGQLERRRDGNPAVVVARRRRRRWADRSG